MPLVASRDTRDVVVIGAGPAGSVAARELARSGLRVLFLDKAKFPRSKVCGCCLNSAALAVLDRIGLGTLPGKLGACPIERVDLVAAGGRRAKLGLRGGVSLSRSSLDHALVEEAVRAGAEFVSERAANIGPLDGPWRTVRVGDDVVKAGVVIAADGLAGTSLKDVPGFEPVVLPGTRVGIGCVVDDGPFKRGAITMVCGRRGYVGAVWLEDGRLDVAGAVDAAWMKEIGGPGAAVEEIYRKAGLRVEGLDAAAWRGTPGLTRRRKIEGERLLVIGDAAGYVEPFTGEGMAWALKSGEAMGSVVAALRTMSAAGYVRSAGTQAVWTDLYRHLIGRRQRECRWMARLLRNPDLSSMAIGVLGVAPVLAAPIVRRISFGGTRSNLEITPS